jgi:alcohol dehydrogenase (cytochrome c)
MKKSANSLSKSGIHWLALGVMTCATLLGGRGVFGQGLAPSALLNPPANSWPTYNGDYSGKRFRPLKQIDQENVGFLTLAWAYQLHGPTTLGLKSTPLLANGVLYFSVPDHVWAVDALTGREIWHYRYQSTAGSLIGNRGVGMYEDRLYFETPDAHLVCLDARTGKSLWVAQLADYRLGYWSTMAPLVVHNHVIVGISGDTQNLRGFIDSFDPITGKLQWRWNAIPNPGEPGADTWPANSDAIAQGGGNTWMTGTYDPELNLLYWGTANPTPVLDGHTRPGANLYTCTIVAVNPDTGKLVWHFQVSPHDVHDFDAVETPVLVDGDFKGHHKLLIQASRNGYFFVLDRTNGKNLLTVPFVRTDWATGINKEGQPVGNPARDPTPAGTLVEPDMEGGTSWMSPSYDPGTGLFYVNSRRSFALYFIHKIHHPEGFAGNAFSVWSHSKLKAIDYHTGKVRWEHDLGPGKSYAGVLTTGGGLVFTADSSGNMMALDARTGKTLWHAYGGSRISSSPMTYELDGRQYVLFGAQGVLYAWALPEAVIEKNGADAQGQAALESSHSAGH